MNEAPPPSSPDVERLVLGSMIIDYNCCKYGISILNDQCFYAKANRLIFSAIADLYVSGGFIDIVLIANYLRQKEHLEQAGGEAYISELVENAATASNIVPHCRILIEKAVLRGCSQTFIKADQYSRKPDALADKLLEAAEKHLIHYRKLYHLIGGRQAYDHIATLNGYKSEVQARMDMDEPMAGLPWPVHELTRITGGAERKKAYLLAGYEKGGKSSFIRACVSMWLNLGYAGVVIMTEESARAVIQGVVACRARIDTKVLDSGKLSQTDFIRFQAQIEELEKQHVIIETATKLTPDIVDLILDRAQVEFIKAGKRIDFCVIDTVQNCHKAGYDSTNDMHESIAKDFIGIKEKYDCPLIQVMQYLSTTERGRNTKSGLSSQIRYGKAYREAADAIITFDDRRKSKKEIEDSKNRGYRIVNIHYVQRVGESHQYVAAKAELQYSSYGDAGEGETAWEEPEEPKKEKKKSDQQDAFFDNVDVPTAPDGTDMF